MTPLALLAPLLLASQAAPPEWGGFRGNNGTGLAAGGGLPEALDPARNLAWRVPVPGGYSSPVVAGGKVFLTGALEKVEGKSVSGKLATVCIDARTGAERWRHELDFQGPTPGRGSCAAPTPATDGTTVVALFHHFGLLAFDLEGKERWRQPLGPFRMPHGLSSSPLLADGLVVVQVDQDQGSYLAAFDAASGAQRWRTERSEFSLAYATPALHRPADGPAQVIASGSLAVAGYSLAGGEKLWWLAGPSRQPKGVPLLVGGRCYVKAYNRPLSELRKPGLTVDFAELLAERDQDHDQRLARAEFTQPRVQEMWSDIDLDADELIDAQEWALALTDNQGGLFALDPGGKGDVSSTHLAWRLDDRRSLAGVTTPVIVGETMFLMGEGSLLTSVSIDTGKIHKQERLGDPDPCYGSPVAGEGRLYFASGGGILTVVRAQPDWQVLATHVLEDAEIWATPALADGAVFVRTMDALCRFADPR